MRFRELRRVTFGSVTSEQRFWFPHGEATGMADLSGPYVRRKREMDETWIEYCAVTKDNHFFPVESDQLVYIEKSPAPTDAQPKARQNCSKQPNSN